MNDKAPKDAIQSIIDQLESMNQLDLLKLRDSIKERFQISDEVISSMSSRGGGVESSPTEDKNLEFDLMLVGTGSLSNINAIKLVSKALDMSIVDAKNAISQMPFKIIGKITRAKAENKINMIDEIEKGLEFEIKPVS